MRRGLAPDHLPRYLCFTDQWRPLHFASFFLSSITNLCRRQRTTLLSVLICNLPHPCQPTWPDFLLPRDLSETRSSTFHHPDGWWNVSDKFMSQPQQRETAWKKLHWKTEAFFFFFFYKCFFLNPPHTPRTLESTQTRVLWSLCNDMFGCLVANCSRTGGKKRSFFKNTT